MVNDSLQVTFGYFTFGYFWLSIQNTTTSQARSLFRVAGVFISFPLARAAVGRPSLLSGRVPDLLPLREQCWLACGSFSHNKKIKLLPAWIH